jgi:hypothetical protein
MNINSKLVLNILWWWIFITSMIDHWATIKFQETIIQEEKNPVGLFLIQLDGGSVALFMTLKMMGLWCIYYILKQIWLWRPRVAILSASILSAIQLFVMCYYFAKC